MDWEYKPENSLGKRAFVRMKQGELSDLFKVREIFVKIATAQQTYTGRLLDISEGGVALALPALLAKDLPVKVGFFLGKTKIISTALVRHARKTDGQYTTGIEFVNLNKESAEFIAELYSAKILRHAL